MELDFVQKASAFMMLKEYPVLLVIILVMGLIILSAVVFVAIVKHNPNLITKFFDKKSEMQNNAADIKEAVENDRRQHTRRAADKYSSPCVVAQCEKYEKLTEFIIEINKRIAKLEEHQDESWLMLLKRDFYSRDMPEQDRLLAGLTYVWWIEKNNKQNGETKTHVMRYAHEHYKLYQMAVLQNEKLRIKAIEESA
jgi:hypothetical protein